MANEKNEGLPINRDIPDEPQRVTTEDMVSASEDDKRDALAGGYNIIEQLAHNPGNVALAGVTPTPAPDGLVKETVPNMPTMPGRRPAAQSAAGPIKAPEAPKEEKETGIRMSGGGRMLTPEEARELGIDTSTAHQLSDDELYKEALDKQKQERVEAQNSDFTAMADTVLQTEKERFDRLERTIALPDDDPRKKELLGDRKAEVKSVTVSQEERNKDDRQMSVPGYDESELLPGYTYEDIKEESQEPEAEEETPPNPGEEEYAEYVRGLEVVDVVHSEVTPIRIIREPQVQDVVETPKSYKSPQNLGDQAFMNAITRFKQERFGKVTVPLVNSGFMVDMVGTGVVDLQQLYINVAEDTKVYEYQMEQMRVIIRNITGANPKVDPVELRNKIHYRDFQMMAFAHLCATLKSVESIMNCEKCSGAFRISTSPKELLLNPEELNERAVQIAQASNVESFSLMSKYKIITTSSGIVITLGHPSYANELTMLSSFLAYYNEMTPSDQFRFNSRLPLLYFIRKAQLPTGVVTNNIYQNYIALSLVDTDDLRMITNEIEKMRKEIIEPKFGIKEVKCPHCGNVNKNVSYRNILDLVFFHFQLESYTRQEDNGGKDTK